MLDWLGKLLRLPDRFLAASPGPGGAVGASEPGAWRHRARAGAVPPRRPHGSAQTTAHTVAAMAWAS